MKPYVLPVCVVFISSLLGLGLAEYLLGSLWGLGDPVIYDDNPIYGYRPVPDQLKNRTHLLLGGTSVAKIRINNLGLRCDDDWDSDPDGKALFLGDSVTYGGSYISNSDLFSALAVRGTGLVSCNAGVNGWGIENIYGLIAESSFYPASVYITTVPEGDFYRGLMRMRGLPFFSRKPLSALDEVVQFLFYKQMNRRYVKWQEVASPKLKEQVAERAIRRLKELDSSIRVRGYKHFIFVSPTRQQSVQGVGRDPLVHALLRKHDIAATYMLDEFEATREQLETAYVDDVHLSPMGHKLWAGAIRDTLRRYQADPPRSDFRRRG